MKYAFIPLISVLLFMLISLTSCGIESFEPVVALNPPLGVTLSNINTNQILVQFWGFNDETYFEGYNIYVALNSATLVSNGGYLHPREGGSTNIPTMWNIVPVSTATHYSFTVTKYTNADLVQDITYFIYVKAYSDVYYIESGPSEIASLSNHY